ncbi:hypothetical protein LTR85_001005 [Meristemomyces frigidus]|nr:hypothetical protein LTR85_001005 [Meristemomyces frigidus]
MDPLTLSTIIQMQLEDSQEVAANTKYKQHEGTVTDAELALQMYTEDLMYTHVALDDRKIAQSMAMTVLSDGKLTQRAYQLEGQIARDHEMATNMQGDAPASSDTNAMDQPPAPQEHDPWTDFELLEKAAAIYMYELCTASPLPPGLVLGSDFEDGTIAESSAWAASRNSNEKRKLGHCVACGEDKDFFDVARVSCKEKHEYCRECLD